MRRRLWTARGRSLRPARGSTRRPSKAASRNIKWALLVVTLSIYYLLPFRALDRGPNAPDQAVLVDFVSNRFYFFFIEIWPQEVYYITGLLVLAAMVLFLMNAIAGRVCVLSVPANSLDDLFYAVACLIEGDRRVRLRNDQSKLTFESRRARHSARRLARHRMVDPWGAWVLYFCRCADAGARACDLHRAGHGLGLDRHPHLHDLTLAGFMREQVLRLYVPWPRIQAALTDEYALNVTYRYDRGEPSHLAEEERDAAPAGRIGGRLHRLRAMCRGVVRPESTSATDCRSMCIQCGFCASMPAIRVMAKMAGPSV